MQNKTKRRSAITSPRNSDRGADFALERYKYILEEIRSMNGNVHKYLALFQTLATVIIGGGIGIFVTWKGLKIDVNTAKIAIQGSLGLLIILTVFITTSIIANIFSWLDYRKEEVELLDKFVNPGFRRPPVLFNFWRWSETYVLLFIILVVVMVSFFVEYQIIPLVK